MSRESARGPSDASDIRAQDAAALPAPVPAPVPGQSALDRRAFLALGGVAAASLASAATAGANVAAGAVVAQPGAPNALAAAAPAVRAARPPRAPGAPRMIRKAVKIGMVQEGETLRDKFALLRDLGFDGVELDSPSELTVDEVLDAIDATGLLVPGVVDSLHWGRPLSHPDPAVRKQGREGLERALHDAKAFGASSVLLVPAVVNASIGYDEAWDRSLAELRRVIPLAEELGVDIALENVWNGFLLSPLEAARYVDAAGSPRVGWHFDVGNVVNFGWPEHWVRILNTRILKLDIKEYSRKRRDAEGLWKGFEVELLEGDCNWPAVMSALDAIGYEGWAAAEIAGGGRERLAEIATRMDRIFAL